MAVLIPSYQPTGRLAEVVTGLRRLDPGLHVLVVDDGSGPAYDARFRAVAEAGAEVIREPVNQGKGAALRTGLLHLLWTRPGEHVVTADSDGQHSPTDILRVAEATAEGTDLVLGCRGFTGDVPLASRFGNAVSRGLFRFAAGFAISDTQTGLRGIPAGLVGWALTVPGDRFEYEQNLLLRCPGAGVTVREVPIETIYLDHNSGTHFRPVRDSVRVLAPVLLFAGSSLAAFAIDTVAFVVLLGVLDSVVLAMVAARVLSATVNFMLNGTVVFHSRGRRIGRQVAGYLLLAVTLLGSSIAGVTLLTGLGVPALVAKLLVESVLFTLSYLVQRRVVFAGRRGGPRPDGESVPRRPRPAEPIGTDPADPLRHHSGLTENTKVQLAGW